MIIYISWCASYITYKPRFQLISQFIHLYQSQFNPLKNSPYLINSIFSPGRNFGSRLGHVWQEELHFVEISWTAAEVLRGPEVPGVEGLFSQEIQDVSDVSPKNDGFIQPWIFSMGKMKFRKHATNSNMNSEMHKLWFMSKLERKSWILGYFLFCSVLKWAIQFLLSYSLWTLAMCWGTLDLGSFNQGRPFWDLPRDQFLQDLEALHGTWMNIYIYISLSEVGQ